MKLRHVCISCFYVVWKMAKPVVKRLIDWLINWYPGLIFWQRTSCWNSNGFTIKRDAKYIRVRKSCNFFASFLLYLGNNTSYNIVWILIESCVIYVMTILLIFVNMLLQFISSVVWWLLSSVLPSLAVTASRVAMSIIWGCCDWNVLKHKALRTTSTYNCQHVFTSTAYLHF